MGWVSGAATICATWEPSDHAEQLAQVAVNFDVNITTTLADIPGAYVFVRAGRTYRVRAIVTVNSGAGVGSRVALASAVTLATMTLTYAFFGILVPAVVNALMFSAFGDPGNVIVETVGDGWWVVDGSFSPTSSGFVTLQFAQAVSDPSTSRANFGSYLEIVEQP